MSVLRVRSAGLATVQDLGRPGLAHLGIAENGAADGWAARVANILVGNAVGRPLIEITGSEFGASLDGPALLAVTGAAPHVVVDGVAQPAWELLVVPAGARVTVPAPRTGLRSYLAVNGRLDAAAVLGSVAPDRLLGVGRRLAAGESVSVRSAFAGLVHPHLGLPVFRLGARRPRPGDHLGVEVTRGPECGEFPQLEQGLPGPYEVSPHSDAIGLRLSGPALARSSAAEIVSRGVPVGALEVTPGGDLLVLLRGRLVTAGYPVVAVATRVGVDRLGQVRPGDQVRFRFVDPALARAAHLERNRKLSDLQQRVTRAFGAVGIAATLAADT